jgi:hypothetical protein
MKNQLTTSNPDSKNYRDKQKCKPPDWGVDTLVWYLHRYIIGEFSEKLFYLITIKGST